MTVKFCLAASGFNVSKEGVLGLSRKDGSAAETDLRLWNPG